MIFNTCPNSEQLITKIVQCMKNIFQIHEASYGSPLKETKRKKKTQPKFGSHWTNKCPESPSNADKMKPFGSPHEIPYFPFAIFVVFGVFLAKNRWNVHLSAARKHWLEGNSGNSGKPWVLTARFCLKNGYPNKLMFHHRSYEKCTKMGKNLIFRPQRWTFSVGVVFCSEDRGGSESDFCQIPNCCLVISVIFQ